MDSFVAGKHLFLGNFLGLILLGFLKSNIPGMAPGFRVFRPISKLTRILILLGFLKSNIPVMTPGFRVFRPISKPARISSALKWFSQIKYFLDSS